jgi:hypothetical protein
MKMDKIRQLISLLGLMLSSFVVRFYESMIFELAGCIGIVFFIILYMGYDKDEGVRYCTEKDLDYVSKEVKEKMNNERI